MLRTETYHLYRTRLGVSYAKRSKALHTTHHAKVGMEKTEITLPLRILVESGSIWNEEGQKETRI